MTATFGYPIVSDTGPSYTPAFSGGSWSATLPLANVADRRIQRVARSTDATAANTKIIVDLGVARSVGVLAVLVPNLTKSAVPTFQWKGGSTSGGTDVYNPGTIQAWPTGVTLEDVTGADGTPMNVYNVVTPTPFTARYIELDIVDTANVNGYLDVARLVVAGAFTPSHTFSIGAQTGHETDTERDVTEGCAALYNPKPARRIDSFAIADVTQTEAFASIRKMQRQLGKSGQLFWIPDPSDTTYGYERNYLGVLRDLSPLNWSVGAYLDSQWSIVEEL